MRNSATFVLKVAQALVDEVSRKRDRVLEEVHRSEAGARAFWNMEEELTLALKLCDSASQSDPNVKLDDGTTAQVVKAKVLFQQGLVAMLGRSDFKKAISFFEQSLAHVAYQDAQYNIALCLLQVKKQDAPGAFQKCIDLDPETEMAIDAGKQLARLGQL